MNQSPVGGAAADSVDSMHSLGSSSVGDSSWKQVSQEKLDPQQNLWVGLPGHSGVQWSPTGDVASVIKGRSKACTPSQSSCSQCIMSPGSQSFRTSNDGGRWSAPADEASEQAMPENNARDSDSNKPRRKKRPTAESNKTNLKLLYANISEWGPKTEKFLTETKYDVIMLVEHRLSMNQLQDKAVMTAKLGYRMAATCAGKAKTENSGGAMVLCKKHLAGWPTARAQ